MNEPRSCPLHEFRTASDEHAGPGNKASLQLHALVVFLANLNSFVEVASTIVWIVEFVQTTKRSTLQCGRTALGSDQ